MYYSDGLLPDMSDGKVYAPCELLFWVKLMKAIKNIKPEGKRADPMTAHRLLKGMCMHECS